MQSNPTIVPPTQRAAPLDVIGTDVTVLHAGASGDVTHQSGEEGSGPPPHQHPWDECFYVLEGAVDFTSELGTSRCGPGTFVHVPAGTTHGFRYGPGGGRMLEFTGPGSKSASMFRALDADARPGPPDIPKLVTLLAEHGARVAT